MTKKKVEKRPRSSSDRRYVILTEGELGIFSAKTAVSIIRYKKEEVACVLDSKAAGQSLPDLIGTGEGIPIVATLKEALEFKPTAMLIGIAPVGGKLPPAWVKLLKEALDSGLDLIAGLHTFLNDNPVLAAAAKRNKRSIWDVRMTPDDLDCSKNIAKDTKCKRVLTVGSDCALGKMSVSLELTAEARRRGWDAEFVATGQTGIMLAGAGLPIDRTISDFTNGASERLVMENKDREILFIEGQGAICHPAYSAVTLGLLHGTAPDAMILCDCPTRKITKSVHTKIPSLKFLIRMYEDLAGIICKSKVVGIALNTVQMSEKKALKAIRKTEDKLGLPTVDVYRTGCTKLMEALEQHYKK